MGIASLRYYDGTIFLKFRIRSHLLWFWSV